MKNVITALTFPGPHSDRLYCMSSLENSSLESKLMFVMILKLIYNVTLTLLPCLTGKNLTPLLL